MAFEVDMTFDHPDADPASLTVGPTLKVRCDSMAVFRPTKGGCVYQHATLNFLTISTADKTVTSAAKFMAAAQKKIHNHAGWYGHGGALTRLTNASTISRNRRVACKSVRSGKGQSCDEYPFASTNQGASLVPPNDSDSTALNAAQNSKVGTYLGYFLLHERIASGDSYYVDIK
jgi:Deoxyribonuclease NucA/NucB